jgi:membrane protease YdiL (CAAX protease family)
MTNGAALTAYLILAALAPTLIWFVKADCADYAAFKRLTRPEDRLARFRVWLIRSVLLFALASIAALALLGRLEALWAVPAEFTGALPDSLIPKSHGSASSGILIGMGVALTFGAVLGAFLPGLYGEKPAGLGDIDALMPRNNAERRLACLLSVSAGTGEEIYFRLMLPLLLVLAGLQPLAAFAMAAVIFGLVHLYQGWKGVLATGAMGAFMSFVYILSGSLWLVVLVHVLIDLNGLVLRPFLARRFGKAQGADQAQA